MNGVHRLEALCFVMGFRHHVLELNARIVDVWFESPGYYCTVAND